MLNGLSQTKNREYQNEKPKKLRGILFLFSSLLIAGNAQAYDLENNVGLRISPLALLGGAIFGEIPLRINNQFSVGQMFAYQNFDFAGTVNHLATGGIRANWHFRFTNNTLNYNRGFPYSTTFTRSALWLHVLPYETNPPSSRNGHILRKCNQCKG